MKKRLLLVCVFLIMFTSLVYAEENSQDQPLINSNSPNEQLASLNFQTMTNNFLEKELKISENIQPILKIILGQKQSLNVSELIISLILVSGFLYLIYKLIRFVPFLKRPMSKLLISILLTLLISLSGILNMSIKFFYYIGNLFNILNQWIILKLIFIISLILLIIYALTIIIRQTDKETEEEKARITGLKTGTGNLID